MPNTTRLNELADLIEKAQHFDRDDDLNPAPPSDELYFNMAVVREQDSTECGTVCCIAGWAIDLYGDPAHFKKLTRGLETHDITVASELLGIDRDTGFRLFFGNWDEVEGIEMSNITPTQAAAQLRKLAA